MLWTIYCYTVIPSGLLLLAMLASGWQRLMTLASQALGTPLTLGFFNPSIATVATAGSLLLAALSYSELQRWEQVIADGVARDLQSDDRHNMNCLRHRGYLWMSLLGTMLWATCWRLKVLHGNQQLVPPKPGTSKSLSVRAMWFVLAVACLLLSDVPLCRMNYQLTLMSVVTPTKVQLTDQAAAMKGKCDSFYENGTGSAASNGVVCAGFCQQARDLSEKRLQTILWVRKWHLTGKVAAVIFDNFRNVTQGKDRIDKLFAEKTCLGVIKSVDKSNTFINFFCVGSALLGIMGFLSALAQALDSTFPKLVKHRVE